MRAPHTENGPSKFISYSTHMQAALKFPVTPIPGDSTPLVTRALALICIHTLIYITCLNSLELSPSLPAYLRQCLTMQPWLSLNSQRSFSFCLPSTGIKGEYHHVRFLSFVLKLLVLLLFFISVLLLLFLAYPVNYYSLKNKYFFQIFFFTIFGC